MADRIVVMSRGKVEQAAAPQEIYHRPATGFVAGFIGRANFMDGVVRDGAVVVGGVALSLPGPAKFLNGSPVQLVCRPEAIRIGAGAEVNSLPGRVTFVRDLGPVRDIHLDTDLGKLVAEQGADQGPVLRAGDGVRIALPPEAFRVFARAPASEPAAVTGLAAE